MSQPFPPLEDPPNQTNGSRVWRHSRKSADGRSAFPMSARIEIDAEDREHISCNDWSSLLNA
jgi:hypothetical protein